MNLELANLEDLIMINNDIAAEKNFIIYLNNKGITVMHSISGGFNLHKFYPEENEIDLQLELLKKFHDAASGYKCTAEFQLSDENGKMIEEMKVSAKQFSRDMKKLMVKSEMTEFEKEMSSVSKEYINKINQCISELKCCNYNKIIERSMVNREICLGNPYFDNLFYIKNGEEKKIKVVNTQKCCYNCVEIDGVNFIRRLSKKKANYNLKKITDDYCNLEGLGDESKALINILITYPNDLIKLWSRYRLSKKNWSEQHYIKKLKKLSKGEEVGKCRI